MSRVLVDSKYKITMPQQYCHNDWGFFYNIELTVIFFSVFTRVYYVDWHPLTYVIIHISIYKNNYQFRSISNGNLCIPRHATESFKRSLQYSGATLWNCLPVTVRT